MVISFNGIEVSYCLLSSYKTCSNRANYDWGLIITKSLFLISELLISSLDYNVDYKFVERYYGEATMSNYVFKLN